MPAMATTNPTTRRRTSRPLQEITGVFVAERFRRDDWFVGVIRVVDCPGSDGSPDHSHTGAPFLRASCIGRTGELTIVGNADPADLKHHHEYRFYGRFDENEQYGRQFRVETFVRAKPHSRSGVIKYLQEAPHVGPTVAQTLWDRFGPDAVRILRESPEVAVAAIGSARLLNLDRAEKASKRLAELAALESCSLEMMDLLTGRGFPKRTGEAAVKVWGNRAAEIIRANPFVLMRFRGCGFLRTDAMYVDLGLPPAKLKRQALCVWHACAKDTEGHTWIPYEQARDGIRAKIGGTEVEPEKAIALARRAKIIRTRHTGGIVDPWAEPGDPINSEPRRLWVADERRAVAEARVARYVAEAFEEIAEDRAAQGAGHTIRWRSMLARGTGFERARWPDLLAAGESFGVLPDGRKCSEHQRGELARALAGPIGIFGGSPGTGKTFTLAALAKLLIGQNGEASVAVAAPTGKAAVRLNENLAAYGVPVRATTIHRLLGVEAAGGESGQADGWSFKHDESNPLPYQFLIIDETSMVDVALMASLLAARNRGTNVLLVGDVNQLPPVGHGAPLRDLIDADLPYGRLTEIRRNAGTIVRACAAIRDGKPFDVDLHLAPDVTPDSDPDGPDGLGPRNLKLIHATKGVAAARILDTVRSLRNMPGETPGTKIDPVWDVQVIVAVNKRSPLARGELNRQLQAELNPTGATVAGSPFRVGDKAICLRNSFLTAIEADEINEAVEGGGGEAKVFVANGEFGRVLAVEPRKLIVEFSNPRRVVTVPRWKGAGDADSTTAKEKGAGVEGGRSGKAATDEAAANHTGANNSENDNDPGSGDDASDTGCDLDLGYAVTCHKMQGSESPIVIVALDEYPGASGRFGICKREWLYTAISRARRVCLLVGLRATADAMAREQAIGKRKTFLRELIEERLAQI